MKKLIKKLNEATVAYDKGQPIISDKEWDDMYFKLQQLENDTGIIYPDSPTHSIHFQKVSELQKKEHEYKPMLSLAKTKDSKEIEKFCLSQLDKIKNKAYWDWFAMFKMDGLSCRLTYSDGVLIGAETRGNGTEGEWIFHNAKVVKNIPEKIPYKDETVIIDGEIICRYDDFEPFAVEYKNPRNFAAGSIRLLDSEECARRNLSFIAWDLIKGCEDIDYNFWRLEKLDDWGFDTVPRVGDAETIKDAMDILDNMRYNDPIYSQYPIDGYVFKFESKEFCDSLGRTDHHFNSAISYKFYDEEYETELLDIEWSMGRTGVLTPVAIFKPLDIDGAIIERASLHNYSVLCDTLGQYPEKNQKIWVAKMNMIIPQITKAEKNNTPHDHTLEQYPTVCPICGKPTEIVESETGVFNITCGNPNCEGKIIQRIDHYCGKKGLDIKGLSEKTIEKLLEWEWIYDIKDIYLLKNYKQTWMKKPGFGEASVVKILNAIEESKNCLLENFIAALGIPEIGTRASKDIASKFKTWDRFRSAAVADFISINGIGEVMANNIVHFDYEEADYIYKNYIKIKENDTAAIGKSLKGKSFVVTGKVHLYKNRDELSAKITSLGGEVKGSVSSKTSYLINNDINSTSSKNAKAKELGIPIITEEQFNEMIT